VLGRIKCVFDKHKIDRKRVRDDGWTLRGRCRYCGEPLVKDYAAGKWVRPHGDHAGS
jgi:hypothetical protein